MKVVVPLRIEAVASKLHGPNQTRIIQGAFRNDMNTTIERGPLFVHRIAKFFEEVQRGVIENGVHGVQAKRVDVIIRNPFQRVRDEKMTNLVAVRVIEVQCRTPRRFVAIGKVRSELRQVISFGSDVVIDDVEHNGESSLMTRINELLQTIGSAIRVLNSKWIDAVVAPITRAGKLRDRH